MESKNVSTARMRLTNALIPKKIVKAVNEEIDSLYPPDKMVFGICHEIWGVKKDLYEAYGYTWYAPSEIYPYIKFD